MRDQLNRLIELKAIPKRIISLVPSQTELLVDLGLQSSLVGITKFCVHPANLRSEVTIVGGTKNVHYDKIKDLTPDLIICNKEENTQEMVAQLEKIAPVWVSDISSIDDSLEMIDKLGEVLNASETASEIVSVIKKELSIFSEYIKPKPSRRVAYLIWKNPYMAAGSQTFINALLKLNKFENIFEPYNGRYPEVTQENLAQADVILLSSEPYPFKDADVVSLESSLGKEVRLVDGEYFSWYGSRLQNAFSYFKSLC